MATSFGDLVLAFLADAKAKAQGGLTLAECGQLFVALTQLAVQAANTLANPGAEKKQLVLEAVGQLWDHLEPYLPLPGWLRPFWPFLRGSVKAIVLAVASGAVEAIYATIKSQGE